MTLTKFTLASYAFTTASVIGASYSLINGDDAQGMSFNNGKCNIDLIQRDSEVVFIATEATHQSIASFPSMKLACDYVKSFMRA